MNKASSQKNLGSEGREGSSKFVKKHTWLDSFNGVSLKAIKISVYQMQLPYVLNSVLFSGNTEASLN